ncbi:MAG TPA: Clp1/GlmU family protein [Candidatus Tectomicrobia bacterium]|nr:Clp1/GlmU family protein [Candidatus Tectomicrobia bacterium]
MTAFIDQPSWHTALEALQRARTILLLGATDTGKTTFLTWAANALRVQGRRIAIVDADVGQSSLGPPTTIGLGVVAQPFHSLQELTPAALYFVGSTSPRGHLVPVIVGTKRMVERAQRSEVDQVMIDTCGFISAGGGWALKHYQIDLVHPDVVVCLQRAHECEGILLAFRYCQRPRILRLPASQACQRRTIAERRLHRERALQRYFAKPKIVTLVWDKLNLIDAPIGGGVPFDVRHARHDGPLRMPAVLWAERRDNELQVVTHAGLAPDAVAELELAARMRIRTWPARELHGTLLGLLDKAGETLGIGILRDIQFPLHRFDVLVPEGIEGIRGIRWSRTQMGPGGELRGMPLAAI